MSRAVSTAYKYTVIFEPWQDGESCRDAYRKHITLPKPLHEMGDGLDDLGDSVIAPLLDLDPGEKPGIIAVFPGHLESAWGGALEA